jgi:hypothetical protein
MTCTGKRKPVLAEKQVNSTLDYLMSLFEVPKDMTKLSTEDKNSFNYLHSQVKSVMDKSKYNKVSLVDVFSFMKKWAA